VIFLIPPAESSVMILLSESDVKTMREGRTVFVDKRHLQGRTFDACIIGLGKSDSENVRMVKEAGTKLIERFDCNKPEPGEEVCKGCDGQLPLGTTFEGKCIVCWATEAKKLGGGRN
jgi:hypothetical protein